jgi:RNA polymerase sigma factor (sigma-70 family)
VISFLKYMVEPEVIGETLESILSSEYRHLVSENALVCLYGMRRHQLIVGIDEADGEEREGFQIPLPQKMRLREAQLEQVTLEGATMVDADFQRANLSEAICARVDLSGANLSNARMEKADFSGASLVKSDLSSVFSVNVNFDGADLSGANLRGANLNDSYLLNTRLQGANLSEITVLNAVLPEALQGLAGGGLNVDQIKQNVQARSPSITEQYWSMIENYYPSMLRVARAMRLGYAFEPQDVVSEMTIRLATPQSIERLMQMDDEERRKYIYRSMRSTLQALQLRKEGLFGDLPVAEIPDKEFAEQLDRGDEQRDQSINELAAVRTEEVRDEETADEEDYDEDYDLDEGFTSIELDSPSEYRPDDSIRFADIDEFVESIPSRAVDPLEKLIIEEITSEMKKALSSQLWRLVQEHYFEDRTVKQIAEERGLKPMAVQRQLAKAKEILNKRMLNN